MNKEFKRNKVQQKFTHPPPKKKQKKIINNVTGKLPVSNYEIKKSKFLKAKKIPETLE